MSRKSSRRPVRVRPFREQPRGGGGGGHHHPLLNRHLSSYYLVLGLRIALELKEAETEIIFGLADVELSKQQLASLFRKEGHKNFRACSDELLMAFLDGLNEFYYVGDID